MTIEVMTVDDTVLHLRALGIPISRDTLSSGIEQGVYPFGDCILTSKEGRKFTIYKRLLDNWIAERATQSRPA